MTGYLFAPYSDLLRDKVLHSFLTIHKKYVVLGSEWSNNDYASKYHLNQLKLAERISNSNNGNDIKKFLLDFRKEEYNICGDNVTPLLCNSECAGQLQYAYLIVFSLNIPTITRHSYNNSFLFNLFLFDKFHEKEAEGKKNLIKNTLPRLSIHS